uniref:G-protein coupled receptors family 1 profile domain-containing protein n=1 Tax=Romanomermis culicivorax TaxID=13658 RepID=A0A915JMR7_ROMCU
MNNSSWTISNETLASADATICRPYLILWHMVLYVVPCVLCLIMLIFVTKKHTFDGSAYRYLLTNLLGADFAYFCVLILLNVQKIYDCGYESIYGPLIESILSHATTVLFLTLVTSIALIAVHRYMLICTRKNVEKYLTLRTTAIFCCATYVISVIFVGFNRLAGCRTQFNTVKFSTATVCSSIKAAYSPHSIYCFFCVYGVGLFYLKCILKLRKMQFQIATQSIAGCFQKRRIRIFYQAMGIWVSMVITLTTYRILPLAQNKYVSTVLDVVALSCQYGIPFISLIFSTHWRKKMMREDNPAAF